MCSFADGFSMFDVTPVENLFIEEYMLRASGDFVKVYIYGLRLCYHPVEGATVPTIARALGMEEKTVLEAFIYWERVGVLRRVADNPPAYSFFNLKQAMLNRKPEGDIPKADRDFNIALQDLFGTRLLQAQDYERVYKIIEELGMAPEVVLLLVKHCIECSGRGTAVTFASIEKEAARCAKVGALNLRAAEDHLRTLSASYEGARNVLRQLGMRRAPTVAEEALAEYSALLYVEAAHGEAAFDALCAARLAPALEIPALQGVGVAQPLARFASEEVYDAVVYRRGAAMLHDVRGLLGDEAFFAALRQYFAQNRFAVAPPGALLKTFGADGAARALSWLRGETP